MFKSRRTVDQLMGGFEALSTACSKAALREAVHCSSFIASFLLDLNQHQTKRQITLEEGQKAYQEAKSFRDSIRGMQLPGIASVTLFLPLRLARNASVTTQAFLMSPTSAQLAIFVQVLFPKLCTRQENDEKISDPDQISVRLQAVAQSSCHSDSCTPQFNISKLGPTTSVQCQRRSPELKCPPAVQPFLFVFFPQIRDYYHVGFPYHTAAAPSHWGFFYF